MPGACQLIQTYQYTYKVSPAVLTLQLGKLRHRDFTACQYRKTRKEEAVLVLWQPSSGSGFLVLSIFILLRSWVVTLSNVLTLSPAVDL